jgi:hypothetical protein
VVPGRTVGLPAAPEHLRPQSHFVISVECVARSRTTPVAHADIVGVPTTFPPVLPASGSAARRQRCRTPAKNTRPAPTRTTPPATQTPHHPQPRHHTTRNPDTASPATQTPHHPQPRHRITRNPDTRPSAGTTRRGFSTKVRGWPWAVGVSRSTPGPLGISGLAFSSVVALDRSSTGQGCRCSLGMSRVCGWSRRRGGRLEGVRAA